MLIVTDKFNGANYREWAQAIKLAVGGRGKMGFLTGATKEPPEAETQARAQWHADNSLVSSWLIKAMTPEIKRSFIFLPSAKAIWVAARESYSDGEDLARLYELETKAWTRKEGDNEIILAVRRDFHKAVYKAKEDIYLLRA